MEYPTNQSQCYPERFLVTLDSLLRVYPIFAKIIDDGTVYQPVEIQPYFTPKPDLARYFFPEAQSRISAKISRTMMSLILADAIITETPENYEFLTAIQPEDQRLTKETYAELAGTFCRFKTNSEMRRLLDLFLIIRGYGRTPGARELVTKISGQEISAMFPIQTLRELCRLHLLREVETLSLAHYEIIRRAINADFDLSEYLGGESSAITAGAFENEPFNDSRKLILAANFFDLIASGGRVNQYGSAIATERLARNFLQVSALAEKGIHVSYHLREKATQLASARDFTFEEALAGIRLSQMMGLDTSAARCIANLLADAYPEYARLVRELNLGYPWSTDAESPVILYYGRNYLTRVHRKLVLEEASRPVQHTLESVAPILQAKIKTLRQEILKNPPRLNLVYLDLTPESRRTEGEIQSFLRNRESKKPVP